MILSTSCKEEEFPNHGIELGELPYDTAVVNNSVFVLNLDIKAEDGLSSVKVFLNQDLVKSFEIKGQKSATLIVDIPIQFELRSNDLKLEYYILVYVKDLNGDILQRRFKIIVYSGEKVSEPPKADQVPQDMIEVTEDIVSDQVWETGKIYLLKGRISVLAPATLTIQPGTIVKASYIPKEHSTLIISRGAKLNAIGSSISPIIFTTEFDQIKPYETGSTLSVPFFPEGFWDRNTILENPEMKGPSGWWGGLVILGNAPGSFLNGDQEDNLPGVPLSLSYGGPDLRDNSGSLHYVSIRYSGNIQSQGSLILAGVGSDTSLEQIEIVGSAGDGVKILGGSVSLKNLISKEIVGNGLQISQGWNGTLNNFIMLYVRDQIFKISGPTASRYFGNHTIKNGSVLAFPSKGLVSLTSNANTELSNIFFYEISDFLEKGIDQVTNSYNSKVDKIEFHIPNIVKSNGGWEDFYSFYPQFIYTNYFSMWDPKILKQVDFKGYSVGPKLSPFYNWSEVFPRIRNSELYPPGFLN